MGLEFGTSSAILCPCRAWVDPEYKKRLLKDGASAATELGIEADGWPANGGVTGGTLSLRSSCLLTNID